MRVANLTSQSTECKFDGKAQGVEIKLENGRIVESNYQKGILHGLTTRWATLPMEQN